MSKRLAFLSKNITPVLIQGPLAGISSAPFRRLIWQYSEPAFTCTEMISCKTILHQSEKNLRRFIEKSPHEGPLCFQLASNHPQELGEAVKRVTAWGADLIDLNCGCPVKKIRRKGAGSSLLAQEKLLAKLIAAMRENTHVPISIKIRVDSHSNEKFNENIARLINESGLDFVTVHGRHWTEHYETPCHHNEIKFFVDKVRVPVIGNGDVATHASLEKMLSTGCDGAMIARASVGQPWLIKKLHAEMRGDIFKMPTLTEISDIFLTHVEELILLLEQETLAIREARTLAKYYARPLANKNEFCERINACISLQELKHICKNYFIQR